MARMTSDFPVASALPGMFLGRDSTGNYQVPLTLVQSYIQQVIASTSSNTDGAVNFRGAWNATYDYAPNDVVSYSSRVYLCIAASALISSTTPDQDPSNWLCLYGTMVTAVDMNTLPNMSFFYAQGAANVPDSDPNGYGYTIRNGTGFAVQVFWSPDATKMYTRNLNSNVWSNWILAVSAYAQTNIPGGEGTGTIWASVANNGEYVSTITVNTQLNLAGWASMTGKVQRCRWEIVNGGAYATTWGPYNNLHWIAKDGSVTTDFTTLGITWNASGSNFFEFTTRDSGATVWARALTS